jgi:hypothetical protein
MCCLGEECQVLAAAAAELVLEDHWGSLHLLIQGPQEVDLTPSAGHYGVGSCDVMEAPADKSTFTRYIYALHPVV